MATNNEPVQKQDVFSKIDDYVGEILRLRQAGLEDDADELDAQLSAIIQRDIPGARYFRR